MILLNRRILSRMGKVRIDKRTDRKKMTKEELTSLCLFDVSIGYLNNGEVKFYEVFSSFVVLHHCH